MKRYVLDTNICLACLRGNIAYQNADSFLKLSSNDSISIISVVTKAELLSLGKKNGWGIKRLAELNKYLEKLYIIDINNSDQALIEAYYNIDAFSQGKLSDMPLNSSSRNMGKNDLWIAATTHVTGAELITMDNDFDHLNNTWFKVNKF